MSVDAFFEQSVRLNMRNIAGKVLMDRNAPDALLDTAQSSYEQTKQLIAKWHNHERSLYSDATLCSDQYPVTNEMAGAVWQNIMVPICKVMLVKTKAKLSG